MESLKHRFAKERVRGWLLEECDDRVALEYPICIDMDEKGQQRLYGTTPWDEFGEIDYERFGLPSHRENGFLNGWDGWVPTYEQCLGIGLLPILIFDVAVQSEGWLRHAFEIVHTNPVSPKKREYIGRLQHEHDVRIHVLDADWVNSRSEKPRRFTAGALQL